MATFTNQTKSSSSWTNGTLDASTFSNQMKTGKPATGGDYYGFGAFTYSGGQATQGLITWTNQPES